MHATIAAFLSLAPFVLSAAPARAGVTVVQEDGVLATTELQGAIDAAAQGDVLLLREGGVGGSDAFWPEEITITDKSLTLVSDGAPFKVQKIVVRNLSAGRTVVLRGVGADATSFHFFIVIPGHGEALVVQNCAGHVRLEDATFWGESAFSNNVFPPVAGFVAANVADCSSVALLRCTLLGGGGGNIDDEDFNYWVSPGAAALRATDSRLVLWQCGLTGGHGGYVDDTVTDNGQPGGAAVLAAGSEVSLGACTLKGGDGGKADFDLLLGAGGNGGDGGDGLQQTAAGGSSEARGCTFTPGQGGSSPFGSQGSSGRPIHIVSGGYSALPGPAAMLQGNAPVREGQQLALTAVAEPGDLLLLLVSPAAAYLQPAALSGVLLAAPVPGSIVLPLGAAGASPLVLTATVPDLGPGDDALVLHIQLVASHAGEPRAGGATMLVLLDAAF